MRAGMKSGAVALAGVLVLSACSVGPDYARPVAVAPAARFLRGEGLEAAPAALWWTGLGDAGLNGLIEQGLTIAAPCPHQLPCPIEAGMGRAVSPLARTTVA